MLEQIIQTKKEELKYFSMPSHKADHPPRSLWEALLHPHRQIGLIAEVKKASPSKGLLTQTFAPVAAAVAYEKAGADAVSVLTDRTYFQGSPAFLEAIKQTVELPVLRKDFLIDRRQIEESRRIGADAILLIAALLSPATLYDFYREAGELGLECLVEVHNRAELQRILDVFQPDIIGVNNRDLRTFQTSIETTLDLFGDLPKDSVIVSESGIKNKADIDKVTTAGVNGVLVGEALMISESPETGIFRLFGDDQT
ncbi:indole-3-glycerol phosphate synthase TrpC [Camelliibacillus cellulosilyticus]|uniref:Indole-3-glycerol phosphate synthase n=1 Tax=Camelliibacillus cellulosilyticus TaxID=2174486 RepID=A0ABV9GHN5_9BACL